MFTLALYLAAASLGQYPFYGEIPQDVPTFAMRFSDGTETYGALWLEKDGVWYRGDAPEFAPGERPTIVYDTLWGRDAARVMKLPEFSVETPVLRQSRREREWEAAGFAPVDTPRGELYYPAEEIKLAQRAKEMADALETDAAGKPDASAASQPSPLEPEGPLSQWGIHIVVAVIGLGITGLVFWKSVLNAD